VSASAPAIDPAPSPALDTITRAPPILLDSGFEDRFQIMRELGRGAMGAVFVAFDRELCREVAVKQILPASIAEPEYQQRFRREYRALAAISDPGVPQVYHSGHSSDGGAWFTMEIVRGEPLRQILSHGPLLPLRALAVAIDLGKTLAVAHAAGIIHRDVKPSNIMLEPGDRVRLLDFGVCSPTKRFLRSAEPYRRTADVDRWQTGEANFAGTFGYSDPNTLDGSPATVRSDVYSVASILYEMLSGRRLCDPDTGIFRAIDSAELPPELAELAVDLRRATDRNPYDRPKTMTDLVQRLEIARGNLLRVQAGARPRPHLLTLALAVLATSLATALTLLTLLDPRPATTNAATSPTSVPTAPPAAPVAAPVPLPLASPPPTTPDPPPDPTAEPPPPTADPPPGDPPLGDPEADHDPVPERPRSAAPDPITRLRRQLELRTPKIADCAAIDGYPGRALTVLLDPTDKPTVRLASGERSPLSRCIAAALADLSLPPGTPTPFAHAFHLRKTR
jgi:serine/threonine protein kinase